MRYKWVQLSDIHHFYRNYNTQVMRDQLLNYLKQLEDKVDLIFITGDLAHKGSCYDQELIKFLDDVVKACGVTRKDTFIIPGNHDIERDAVADRLAKQILSSTDVMKEINGLDERTYQLLLSGQESFFNFYKEFLGEEYPRDSLHFIKRREGINIVHINTCMIAGLSEAEGQILVGLDKLYQTLKMIQSPETSVNIALGHHTLGCIHPNEKGKIMHRFSDAKIDLYLNGHVHKATYQHDDNNDTELYSFTCGAGVVDDYADALFMTGVIDTNTAEGQVKYHLWNTEGEYWHVANSVGRKVRDGSYKFEVSRLKKKTEMVEEEPLQIEVDEDELKDFLIDFHHSVNKEIQNNEMLVPKDITDKFESMMCSSSFRNQFDKCSVYFPVINKIMGSTSFLGIDKRFIIPDIIITEYINLLHYLDNGDLILTDMVNNLFAKYRSRVSYSDVRLKAYIKVLICWSIYECDIFNEDKRQKDVV